MRKVVKLTESDLNRLVKKIIKEDYDFAEKHYEYDRKTGNVLLRGASSKFVNKVLNNLPSNLSFLSVVDCDFADFNGVDLCSYDMLVAVRLADTESNLGEQGYECLKDEIGGLYLFKENQF